MMTTEIDTQVNGRPRGEWARQADRLTVENAPEGVTTINVDGRQAIGALDGFGQLWKKRYTIRLPGVPMSASQVMDLWKQRFPEFQPPGNRFYPPKDGVAPGKVMLIDSPLPVVPPLYNRPGVVPMTSGVMILFTDDTSLGVMTPEGFPVAGWNNFSVYEDDDGTLVGQVLSYERATDPIYEFGFRVMGGAKRQEFIWKHVLTSLAAAVGITGQPVTVEPDLLDSRLQWKYAGRVFQNAGIRTTLYMLAAPIRWALSPFRGKDR